jgi:hypothetical protein
MFEAMVDAVAQVVGCDPRALAGLALEPAADLAPEHLLDRVAAAERAVAALQAVQARDLAAANTAYLTGPDRTTATTPVSVAGAGAGHGPIETLPHPDVPTTSRMLAVEVGLRCRVAPMTATMKIAAAVRLTSHHPRLLALLGTGMVSWSGIGRVLDATAVLGADQTRHVDALVAADATHRYLTPATLGQAARRRAVQVDPGGATVRVRAARRSRTVRLCDSVDGTAALYARLRAEEAVALYTGLDTHARAMRGAGDPRSLDTLRADLLVASLTTRTSAAASPDDQSAAAPGDQSTTPGRAGRTGPADAPAPAEQSAAGPAQRSPAAEAQQSPAAAPSKPTVWSSGHGYEICFDPPPSVQPDDPPPDDPVWDTYLHRPPGTDPDTGPDPGADLPPPLWRTGMTVEVQVVVALSSLLGLDHDPALLRGYGAVPVEAVYDICSAAEAGGATTTLRGLFCDPTDGRLLTMEAKARSFSGSLRAFAVSRDHTCRLTGAPITDIDHILERASGGATSAGNGQALAAYPNRTLKAHPAVRSTPAPERPRGDGLDAYRHHAPTVTWTLPSGHAHHCVPPPTLGYGSDAHPPPPPPSPPAPYDGDNDAWST